MDIYKCSHTYLSVAECAKPLPACRRMRRKGTNCGLASAFACTGRDIKQVGETRVSLQELAKRTGMELHTFSGRPKNYALYSATKCRTRSVIIYTQGNKTGGDRRSIICKARTRKLICAVWQEKLYPTGHCFAILPPGLRRCAHAKCGKTWTLRDPWRADGLSVGISLRQVNAILRGVDSILMSSREGITKKKNANN